MPRARVLCVDDDPDVSDFVLSALSRDEIEVTTASSPEEALAHLQKSTFDLLLLDVNLPGMTGLQLRDRVRAEKGAGAPPVLFLSGADPDIERQIARQLGGDRLLLKPLPRTELRRAVFAALGLTRRDRGRLPDALDRMLYEIAENRETGILTAVRGTICKRIVMQDGDVVFAASNDPKDLIGQAMLRSGLISEADLTEAFAAAAATPGPAPKLGAALTAMRKVTPEQCQKVFESKMRESVLDVFLWESGEAEFVGGGIDQSDMPFPLCMKIQALRTDGLKRRRRWSDVRRVLPDFSVSFKRVAAWPEGFPATAGDKLIAQLLDSGASLQRMLLDLRGQSYAVGVRVAELVQKAVLEPTGRESVTAVATTAAVEPVSEVPTGELTKVVRLLDVDGSSPPAQMAASGGDVPATAPGPQELDAAIALLREGKPAEAHVKLLSVLASDPLNALARERLAEAEKGIIAEARKAGLRDEVTLRLGKPLAQLVSRQLAPTEAFVLSRFAAGPMNVGALVNVCPLPPHELLTLLRKLLAEGLLKQ